MHRSTTEPETTGRPVVVPAASRRQRRPMLLVASVLLIVLGASGGALAWFSIGTATDAVVARTQILRGQVLAADDFVVVQVNPDPQLAIVSPDAIASMVGLRAAHDVAAGGLVDSGLGASVVVPVAGSTVVGLSLAPGFYPDVELLVGDRVRVVLVEPAYACATTSTPADGVDAAGSGDCLNGQKALAGTVVAVRQDPASSQMFLSVQVDQSVAPQVAAAAALGKAAVVLESRER